MKFIDRLCNLKTALNAGMCSSFFDQITNEFNNRVSESTQADSSYTNAWKTMLPLWVRLGLRFLATTPEDDYVVAAAAAPPPLSTTLSFRPFIPKNENEFKKRFIVSWHRLIDGTYYSALSVLVHVTNTGKHEKNLFFLHGNATEKWARTRVRVDFFSRVRKSASGGDRAEARSCSSFGWDGIAHWLITHGTFGHNVLNACIAENWGHKYFIQI